MNFSQRDVLVIGAGLAGLTAAVHAAEAGAKVIVLEQEKSVGGNSAKATGGINACATRFQRNVGIEDNTTRFIEDTLKGGDYKNDKHLVTRLTSDSKTVLNWLVDEIGVPLTEVIISGGHSVPRSHCIRAPKTAEELAKPAVPLGLRIIWDLQKFIKLHHRKSIAIECNKDVKSAKCCKNGFDVDVFDTKMNKNLKYKCRSLVLTTGGFSCGPKLLAEFAPKKSQLPTTCGSFSQGRGIEIARELGGALINMDVVQLHPTAFIDPHNQSARSKFLATEALRGRGAILFNSEGRRFVDELSRRDVLTNQIIANCKFDQSAQAHAAWLLVDENIVQGFGQKSFAFYWKVKGFFQKCDSIKDLGVHCHISPAKLHEMLQDYKMAAERGRCLQTKKRVFRTTFRDAPFYVAKITPALHYTMGGVRINELSQVCTTTGHPINGLFAAGEIVGGLHGTNRLMGNGLLECLVFGRQAGRNAAAMSCTQSKL